MVSNCLKILFAVSFFFLVQILPAYAQLVPCGGPGQDECTLCHFFAGFSELINFIVFTLTPPVAALMFLIGGVYLLTSGGSESQREKGKKYFTNTVVALVIIYASWLFINTLLKTIAKGVDGYAPDKWYEMQCKPFRGGGGGTP